ncbi:MAG: bifunctional phosphopantothenoylcysteine decarboxylase/phosphopantothenate--cysteine ligase CoaBC [Melioribacter sp.]|nr:bifunctional phosphopantothenoylcysteine decarboxylase/phosphopantothenate--cysteine ligase CoaBC [Melioribacter sp.]
MSNYKILFGITGSIAAYKSAYLISKLLQNGFEVKVVATNNALKFLGDATLEGLTGGPVYVDSFQSGEMMNHINLIKWADLFIVCPASANTINKLANGIADNLLTSLFLAYDFKKPLIIAPAMNLNMYEHPITKNSLKKLAELGIKILPTDEGYLACGDYGKGKLLNPDEIYEHILISLTRINKQKLKLLITAGGTKENIDGVRYITNLSTGKTASAIANYFLKKNYDVTFLHAFDSKIPSYPCTRISFSDFNDLNEKVRNLLEQNDFDVVIHNAAVSDYSIKSIKIGNEVYKVPLQSKIDSENEEVIIHLKKNFKILERIKNYSKNKNIIVIAFKFTNTNNKEQRIEEVKQCFDKSSCDIVVNNDLTERDINNVQNNFYIYDKFLNEIFVKTSDTLAIKLEEIIANNKGDKN